MTDGPTDGPNDRSDDGRRRLTVIVCLGPTCGEKRDAGALYDRLHRAIADGRLPGDVTLARETCFGHCLRGPNILVCDSDDLGPQLHGYLGAATPSAVLYNRMTADDLDRVIDRHLKGGMVVRPLLDRRPVRDP
jgi:(2Fe-2S) ferredoxin